MKKILSFFKDTTKTTKTDNTMSTPSIKIITINNKSLFKKNNSSVSKNPMLDINNFKDDLQNQNQYKFKFNIRLHINYSMNTLIYNGLMNEKSYIFKFIYIKEDLAAEIVTQQKLRKYKNYCEIYYIFHNHNILLLVMKNYNEGSLYDYFKYNTNIININNIKKLTDECINFLCTFENDLYFYMDFKSTNMLVNNVNDELDIVLSDIDNTMFVKFNVTDDLKKEYNKYIKEYYIIMLELSTLTTNLKNNHLINVDIKSINMGIIFHIIQYKICDGKILCQLQYFTAFLNDYTEELKILEEEIFKNQPIISNDKHLKYIYFFNNYNLIQLLLLLKKKSINIKTPNLDNNQIKWYDEIMFNLQMNQIKWYFNNEQKKKSEKDWYYDSDFFNQDDGIKVEYKLLQNVSWFLQRNVMPYISLPPKLPSLSNDNFKFNKKSFSVYELQNLFKIMSRNYIYNNYNIYINSDDQYKNITSNLNSYEVVKIITNKYTDELCFFKHIDDDGKKISHNTKLPYNKYGNFFIFTKMPYFIFERKIEPIRNDTTNNKKYVKYKNKYIKLKNIIKKI